MKPKIYVPQEPMFKVDGRWQSKGFNIAPISEFGDMVIIWGPDSSIATRQLIEQESKNIADAYDDSCDYIVALGSPTLIAILAWSIGERGKRLRILEWDRKMARYYPTLSQPV